jgi:hypothetical protein
MVVYNHEEKPNLHKRETSYINTNTIEYNTPPKLTAGAEL